MKKKLFHVLLVLSLCTALAIPAFAGPVEEPTVPEGTIELEGITTPEEIVKPEEVVPEPEETEVFSEEPCVDIHPGETSDCIWEVVEVEKTGENTIRAVYHVCSDSSQVPMSADIISVASAQEITHSKCSRCGKYNWGTANRSNPRYVDKNGLVHTKEVYIRYFCQTPECFLAGENELFVETQDYYHSYNQKGSLVRAQSVDGSTHEATYNYSCVCGRTMTKPETESHSMKKMEYTSNNYHRGALHYLEWTWSCTKCGYTETRWESRSCPGNNDGTGCNFPINRVDPPVEVQDVTGPEEAT